MKKQLLILSGLFLAGLTHAQTTILQENFNSGLPGSWTQTTLASDGGWLAGTATSLSSTSWTISNTNNTGIIATNDDDCDCNKSADRLISPTLDLSTVSTARLSVDVFYNNGTYQGAQEEGYIAISTNGGTNWTNIRTLSGEAGWRTELLDLTAYVGQSNVKISFLYDDDGGWLFGYAIDNFHVYEPAPVDVELTNLSVYPYVVAPASQAITGTITNLGGQTLTSVDIDWNDGTPHSATLSVNIAPLATYNFTHPTTLNVTSGLETTINVTATASGDANTSNDNQSTMLWGLTFDPTTRVFGEEGTGTWCGWCPRGAVFMEQMATDYPNTWVGVAVHNSTSDPMRVTAYDNAVSALISGYPSGLVDRANGEFDPSDFPAAYADRITKERPADVTVSNTWNSSTRVMSITVTATFAANISAANMRLAAVVVEDDVTGTSSGYNQTNYYSSQANNIPLTGAGHNWQTEPNPVPAASMTYDHVARAILPSFAGQTGSIPSTTVAGTPYSYSFNYTVPASQDETMMKVIGIIVNQDNGEVVNAVEAHAVLGVEEQAGNFAAKLYPNPANDMVALNLNINEASDVTIEMYNIAGALVNSSKLGNLNGENRITLNTSSYEAGIYTVHINVGGNVMTKKLVITH